MLTGEMGTSTAIERVLINARGEMAWRLIAFYREREIESVVVFSEADAEQPWLDDADYAVYLNGRTVAETYADARRVVSAAIDAGCDAIHPGYCFLAQRPDFFDAASKANMLVVGPDPRALIRVVDRMSLRGLAQKVGISLIPASEALPDGDDGIAAGAQLGAPLFVKAVDGKAYARARTVDELPSVIAQVRDASQAAGGGREVYLERAVDSLRKLGTPIAVDKFGNACWLGLTEASLQHGFRTWVEEAGEVGEPGLQSRLGEAAVRLPVDTAAGQGRKRRRRDPRAAGKAGPALGRGRGRETAEEGTSTAGQ